ncbi:MAG: 30S ribosomal protein S8 [Armatimonadetes bacterium]|nr:30S ribosomal protein S8 [Armatimonadota bacterium]
MHSDPIADLLTRIRNASRAKQITVQAPHSKIKEEIVKILVSEGYLRGYEVTTEAKFPLLKMVVSYDEKRQPILKRIDRISKPGLRDYRQTTELKPLRNGLATRIISTSQGLMTDREARKRKIGGEVLCEVY